jgi:hypothetical protein
MSLFNPSQLSFVFEKEEEIKSSKQSLPNNTSFLGM